LMRDVVAGQVGTASRVQPDHSEIEEASAEAADVQVTNEPPNSLVSSSAKTLDRREPHTSEAIPAYEVDRSDVRAQAMFEERSAAPASTVYHWPLEIRCFGSFTALRDGEEVRNWERPAAREVLAYLAVFGWHGISSDQLLEALVPERDRESAAKILHPRLAFLRKAIRDDKERPFIRF